MIWKEGEKGGKNEDNETVNVKRGEERINAELEQKNDRERAEDDGAVWHQRSLNMLLFASPTYRRLTVSIIESNMFIRFCLPPPPLSLYDLE